MNAMIFAAGLGTRLRPLTDNCPKALVKIGDQTMLEIALNKMRHLGITKVVVNVHHFATQVTDFIRKYNSGEMQVVISDESNQLLDTGGALLKAAPLFDKGAHILVYNVDVITNAPIEALIACHYRENNLATLLVQDREASRYLIFDQNNLLCGWRNPKTAEEIWVSTPKESKQYGFNGIQILNYELLSRIKAINAFPIIPEYLQLAKAQRIAGWSNWTGDWFDLGTPEKVNTVRELFNSFTAEKRQTYL
jgi:N-acetyl-alpha-D-muramate 1-phosphate uridylyltransferase